MDMFSAKKCKPLEKYPLKVKAASGTILGGKPLLCGGLREWSVAQPDSGTYSECFMHERATDEWKLHAKLLTPRLSHSSVNMNGTVWVAGGTDGEHLLKTTEFIYADGLVEKGPDLPNPIANHCAVDLKDGRAMLIGGAKDWYGTDSLLEVWIYDSRSMVFTRGPPLQYHRAGSACALFQSPLHGGRPVVLVAGGIYGIYQTEMLDFTNKSAVWENGEFSLKII